MYQLHLPNNGRLYTHEGIDVYHNVFDHGLLNTLTFNSKGVGCLVLSLALDKRFPYNFLPLHYLQYFSWIQNLALWGKFFEFPNSVMGNCSLVTIMHKLSFNVNKMIIIMKNWNCILTTFVNHFNRLAYKSWNFQHRAIFFFFVDG